MNLEDKEKKHVKSNKRRLKSLKQKCNRESKERLLIQTALKSDQVLTKQHIKFDDSDSDDQMLFTSSANISNKTEKNDILGFENDSEEITLNPLVTGKGAEKLMQIQSKIGFDERFKVDARFIGSGDDTDGEESEIVNDMSDEVKKNLAILQQVVGPTTVPRASKRKTLHFNDPSVKRYDPTKQDHSVMEINNKKENNLQRKKVKKNSEPLPEVTKDQFYEINVTDLKQAFGKSLKHEKEVLNHDFEKNENNDKPFSILNMLGRDHANEDDMETSNKMSDYKLVNTDNQIKVKPKSLRTKAFEGDSSESDDDDDTSVPIHIKSADKDTCSSNVKSKTYFFCLKGVQIVNAEHFCTNKTYEINQKEWLEIKDHLREDFKNKHKKAIRSKKRQLRLSKVYEM